MTKPTECPSNQQWQRHQCKVMTKPTWKQQSKTSTEMIKLFSCVYFWVLQFTKLEISATCWHVPPRCQQCHLELSQRHHVAKVLTWFMAGSCHGWWVTAQLPSHIHDSWSHYSNWGKVQFLRKNGLFTRIETYDTIFATFLHQITPLLCNFLWSFAVFSLYPKESANMLAYVIPTQHVTSSGMVQTTEFYEILGWHSQNFPKMLGMSARHVILGGQPTRHNAKISD